MLSYCVAGVLVGIAYTLSPLTVWFGVTVALMIWAVGRGLPSSERRRIEALLIVAIAVRVAAVVGLFMLTDHARVPFGHFFGDEEYFIRRSMWLRNVGLGIPIHRADLIYAFDDYSDTSQLYVFAFIQTLVGFAPYGLHLVGISLYVGAALLLFRFVRSSFGAAPACVALIGMLSLPSLFAWSISALKEPLFFALTAVALWSAAASGHGPWRRRLIWFLMAIAAALMLQTVRRAGLALELASILGGLALAWLIVRPKLLIGVTVATTIAGAVMLARPDVQVRGANAVIELARLHRGHIWTAGHTYKLLDVRLYDELSEIRTMTLGESGQYVVRALVSYVTVPLPNEIYSTAALAYLPEQIVWYLIVALVPIGLIFAMRRDVRGASLLLVHALVAALPVAMTGGNIGTLVRHRGFALPYLTSIAAVGGCELVARCRRGVAMGHGLT